MSKKPGPKPGTKKPRITTTISLPEEKRKKLGKLSRRDGVSRSVWVEQKIDEEEV